MTDELDDDLVPVSVMFPSPLVAARCTRCGQMFAIYYGYLSGSPPPPHLNIAHRLIEGWEEGIVELSKPCVCDPPPELPTGAELDDLLARARQKSNGDPAGTAPIGIRV